MTDLFTNDHNNDCLKKGESVRIVHIDLNKHKALLECGCEINFVLKCNITTFYQNQILEEERKEDEVCHSMFCSCEECEKNKIKFGLDD